ncbi:MAG: PIN domain-containing protein [Ignavibacteria bacterium]|nr:PIN domain-containing protein [Ignavibacteria bacterium]
MKDKVFLDTNILIYSFSKDKGEIIQSIINTTPYLQISTQVLNEFINASLRKNILTVSEVIEHCKNYISSYNLALIFPTTINYALEIKNKYQYSYYDSLIVSTAIESDCEILYTEDLQHNQIIEDKLTIINPFA